MDRGFVNGIRENVFSRIDSINKKKINIREINFLSLVFDSNAISTDKKKVERQSAQE